MHIQRLSHNILSGAIFAQFIASPTIENSLFFHCYITVNNDVDSGCVALLNHTTQSFIKSSRFINSKACYGGVSIDYSTYLYSLILTECSVQSCNGISVNKVSQAESFCGRIHLQSLLPISSSTTAAVRRKAEVWVSTLLFPFQRIQFPSVSLRLIVLLLELTFVSQDSKLGRIRHFCTAFPQHRLIELEK